MNSDMLLVVIPALIALIGTLLTLYITVYQKRKQNQHEDDKQNKAEIREAYKTLWQKLENVNILLRTDFADLLKCKQAMTDVNAFILQNAFVFDQQDQDLSNQYMQDLAELTEIVLSYAETIPQLKYGWEITAPLDVQAIQQFETEQQAVVANVNKTRELLLQKCKSKISA